MNGLSDSLTIGILLLLIFGAACFYLYSKIGQIEKRMSLLENLLLSLKMNTEASLDGPDLIEAISPPTPLNSQDVEGIEEESYEELLQQIPTSTEEKPSTPKKEQEDEEQEAEELLRSIPTPSSTKEEELVPRSIDVNYESMTAKELSSLAKSKGLQNIPRSKRDLIDYLKQNNISPPPAPLPLPVVSEEMSESGFEVSLDNN